MRTIFTFFVVLCFVMLPNHVDAKFSRSQGTLEQYVDTLINNKENTYLIGHVEVVEKARVGKFTFYYFNVKKIILSKFLNGPESFVGYTSHSSGNDITNGFDVGDSFLIDISHNNMQVIRIDIGNLWFGGFKATDVEAELIKKINIE